MSSIAKCTALIHLFVSDEDNMYLFAYEYINSLLVSSNRLLGKIVMVPQRNCFCVNFQYEVVT